MVDIPLESIADLGFETIVVYLFYRLLSNHLQSILKGIEEVKALLVNIGTNKTIVSSATAP